MQRIVSIASFSLLLAACGGAPPAPDGASLTPAQKAVAQGMTSIWENDTPKLDYAYSENIGDGRGYTSGYAGFCTGTGDAIQVVDCYDKRRTDGNLMVKYMPALQEIDAAFMSTGDDQADTSKLDAVGSWIADWAASADTVATKDDFRACEDEIVGALYYGPAMEASKALGLETALTRAALYDMWINQGDDTLVTQTNEALHVSERIGVGNAVTEDEWLQKFLELRVVLLAGDSTWKDSVDRVAAYEKARRRENWALSQAVDSDVKAAQCWPGKGYKDSGYTAWSIRADGSYAVIALPAAGCE